MMKMDNKIRVGQVWQRKGNTACIKILATKPGGRVEMQIVGTNRYGDTWQYQIRQSFRKIKEAEECLPTPM
jgi:hypothetical protein